MPAPTTLGFHLREALIGLGLLLGHALARTPWPMQRAFGSALGSVAHALAASRRRICRRNLDLCFPHLSKTERAEIARAHFREYGQALVDRFFLWTAPRKQVEARVRLLGMETFDALKDKPLIVLAPHFMGLDAGGLRLQALHRMATMYSLQSSPRLNRFMLSGRSRFNQPLLVSRQEGMTKLVRALMRHTPIYFLPDMDLGPRDAVFVPFFDQEAATVTSVVRLAQRTGAYVLPLVTRLTPDGYEGRFYPAWQHLPDEPVEEGARRMNAFIEDRVRESPSQYLWTHRRFKTRPDGAPSVYRQRP